MLGVGEALRYMDFTHTFYLDGENIQQPVANTWHIM
jgi:hypothetical protein